MATVAIVGRKNVGKSSIFNRLLGMRLSIVHKEPGVTRDRVYGEVNWCGKTFDMIDTGGFFPNEDILLAKSITRQIELALDQADLIYLVVDAKTGLMPSDHEIAQQLRKVNKKVFLLINKVDNKKDREKIYEFTRLGFESAFLVSAEAGIGFGEVLDETLAILPAPNLSKHGKTIKIMILGRPNAGKSTLLNSIIKEERAIVDEKPGTTRDLVNARLIYKNSIIEIIDTAGLKRRGQEPIEFYSMMRAIKLIGAIDIIILIFDINQGVVAEDRHIVALILGKAKGFVIAPNKIDTVSKEDIKRVLTATRRSFEFVSFAPIVPISAKNGTGIEELLNTTLNIYREASKTVDKKTLKNLTQNLQAPSNGSVLNITQTGIRPPVFQVELSAPVKEGYVRYLRNMLRNYFGFSGVPILIKTQIIKGRR